jgi:hypothetical protein
MMVALNQDNKAGDMPDDDALLTSQDVADRYRVHVRTIPDLVEQGRIPAPLEGWTGATKRWLKSEIVAHMRKLRKQEQKQQVA